MFYFRFLIVTGMFLVFSGTVLSQFPVHDNVEVKIDLLR